MRFNFANMLFVLRYTNARFTLPTKKCQLNCMDMRQKKSSLHVIFSLSSNCEPGLRL